MNDQNHHDATGGDELSDARDAQFVRAIGVLAEAVRRLAEGDEDVRRAIRIVAESVDGAGKRAHLSAAAAPVSHRRGGVGLDLVAQRASVKARACRAVAEHGESHRAHTQRLVTEARSLRGCWLWMLQPEGESLSSASAARMAEIYENLARAASYVQGVALDDEPDGETTAEAYRLLAEAQSALWAALSDLSVHRDQDQIDAFIWLRERTRDERVYLDRFMRREDPADPESWNDLRARIDAASGGAGGPQVVVRSAISVS